MIFYTAETSEPDSYQELEKKRWGQILTCFSVWQSLVDKFVVQLNLANKQTYVFCVKRNYWHSLVSILCLY